MRLRILWLAEGGDEVMVSLLQVTDRSAAGINKVVKKAKQIYHPDCHVRKSLYEQLFAEEAFKAINEASQRR